MLNRILAEAIGHPTNTVTQLLKTPARRLYDDPVYKQLVTEIDNTTLQVVGGMRPYLDKELPTIVEKYKKKYNMTHFPLDSMMLCNWVLGFANMTLALPLLLEKHTDVSRQVMRDALPDLLHILDKAPEGSHVWKKTFAILVIPLVTYEA